MTGIFLRLRRYYSLAVALVGLLLGVTALYIGLEDRAGGESSAERELREVVPRAVGFNCRPYWRGEISEDPFLRHANARVACRLVDSVPRAGLETVYYFSFPNPRAERAFMREYAQYLRGAGTACREDYLERERWVDQRGKVRGELLCREANGRSVLLWSERRDFRSKRILLAGLARSPESPVGELALHHWWQRDVKHGGDGPPRDALVRLRALLPRDRFGRCIRDPEGIPSALVAVRCIAGDGISASGGALFPSRAATESYMSSFVRAHPGAGEGGCARSAVAYGAHSPGGSPSGKLFCFVAGGTQWLVWTADDAHVFAYAARRDGNRRLLLRQWSHSLSRISLLRSDIRSAP